MERPDNISIMGSTGSIGTQTLDIIRRFPGRFRAVALTANRNWELLAHQAGEFAPDMVVIADKRYYEPLKEALAGSTTRVEAGEEALVEAAVMEQTDTVVGALVGYSGLRSTVAAIEAGKRMALANKETLVAGGEIIDCIIKRNGNRILPVDSEHSAIFQCLQGETENPVHKIILTASGGPFRDKTLSDMENASVETALNHPNWKMGVKVTIDSATMMNKGFEMIEARWLFDTPPERIEVLVHPQSIVHSMVEFEDGSVKAQLGLPDMHIPIAYALDYPRRLGLRPEKRLDLTEYSGLTFSRPDLEKFPLLGLAYIALEAGGVMPTVLNAANEVGVRAFLEGRIKLTEIPVLVEQTMAKTENRRDITIDDIARTHEEATATAESIINNRN